MKAAMEAAERRTGTQRLITEMLEERQEMWVLYCKVAGLEPFNHEGSVRDVLERFCQVLVDYISTGHFGLYERIAEGKERRVAVRDMAAEVYQRISTTTDVAVRFNDAYDASSDFELDENFAGDLSSLGEALALRIELEDKILARMA